jgi:hypothetical protein
MPVEERTERRRVYVAKRPSETPAVIRRRAGSMEDEVLRGS